MDKQQFKEAFDEWWKNHGAVYTQQVKKETAWSLWVSALNTYHIIPKIDLLKILDQ